MPAPACRLAGAPKGSFRLECAAQRRLCRGQPRDRHAIGRAGHVVEPGLVTEKYRGRVAAMLAADAKLELGPRLAATLGRDVDQFAHALDIERGEGIMLEDAALLVLFEERRRVVTAQPKGGLGEIIGAKAEEIRRQGDVTGTQGGAR